MRIKLLALAACLLLTFMAGISCAGVSAPQLSIEKQELTRPVTGPPIAKVTIKNTGRNIAELARVEVIFYDAGKNVISTAADSIMNLKPGETWDFQLFCLDQRASQVKSFEARVTAASSSGGL